MRTHHKDGAARTPLQMLDALRDRFAPLHALAEELVNRGAGDDGCFALAVGLIQVWEDVEVTHYAAAEWFHTHTPEVVE